MEDEEEQIRDELSAGYLHISEWGSLMFDNIDSFVALSRENTSVKSVNLYPFDSAPGNYEFWDKVGQIVGNLMELHMIDIHFLPHPDEDDGVTIRRPDWEILTRILPYVQHKILLCSSAEGNDYDAEVEDIRGLARAIHGHPMISGYRSQGGITFENMGPWCSALATLPSLDRVEFGLQEPESVEQRFLLNVEPLKELLRTPALRFVIFNGFYFTNEICYAIANALEEGSSVIDITFKCNCSFPGGGRAVIANALKINATVTDIHFFDNCDEPFGNSLAAVLLCNSTLQNLTLCRYSLAAVILCNSTLQNLTLCRNSPQTLRRPGENAGGRWLSSIFLSLGMNTTLKSLSVSILDKLEDKLCAAISKALTKNSTLEDLSLHGVLPSDDDGAVSARNALSFLRTDSALKSLTVSFAPTKRKLYALAFRLEAVKMMDENPLLESLTIIENSGYRMKVEESLALVSALQLNTTLKTLGFASHCFRNICFTANEVSQLVSILMKNYGLERLVPDIPCVDDRAIKAILRLNAAGRRYLIKDGSSISKGVDVLSAVSDEIDCVFLHLLENPSLCDRRAAETTTGRQ